VKLSDQIDFEVQCLRDYFERLFLLANETSKIQPPFPSESDLAKQFGTELAKQFVSDSVAAFIRPDMACNIYSLLDFWLTKLCSFHEGKRNLPLNHTDIKGRTQLDAYHKYFTKVALLDLTAVLPSLECLNSLREVRNCVIHGGAHVSEAKRKRIETIPGISVVGSLVVISDDFIWDSLEHARTYLRAVATA